MHIITDQSSMYEILETVKICGFNPIPKVGQRYLYQSGMIKIDTTVSYITKDGLRWCNFGRSYQRIEQLHNYILLPTSDELIQHINNVCGRDYQINYHNDMYVFTFNNTNIMERANDLLTVLCLAFIKSYHSAKIN